MKAVILWAAMVMASVVACDGMLPERSMPPSPNAPASPLPTPDYDSVCDLLSDDDFRGLFGHVPSDIGPDEDNPRYCGWRWPEGQHGDYLFIEVFEDQELPPPMHALDLPLPGYPGESHWRPGQLLLLQVSDDYVSVRYIFPRLVMGDGRDLADYTIEAETLLGLSELLRQRVPRLVVADR